MRQMSCFVQTRVKTFYFVQVTDLIIKPNFVQSSSMSLKIILCTRLSLDIVHIKVKSTVKIKYASRHKNSNFSIYTTNADFSNRCLKTMV